MGDPEPRDWEPGMNELLLHNDRKPSICSAFLLLLELHDYQISVNWISASTIQLCIAIDIF